MTEERTSHAARRSNPVAVVIVSYNSADVLPGVLSSLQDGLAGEPDHQIIVVDNASKDDSVALSLRHPIRPRVLQMGRNAGYAAAINAAAAQIRQDADLLVLNPDIRLMEGSVRAMRECLADPSVGVVVPQILDEDDTVALSLRREPSLATAWLESIVGGTVARRLGMSEIISDPSLYEDANDVDWATGAILLVSSEARWLVGDWDESFFLYSEEVDFMRRVRHVGLKIRYHPDAKAFHKGGDTHANPHLFSLSTVNRVLDYRRHHRWLPALAFRLGVASGEAIRFWRGPEHRAALAATLRRRPHDRILTAMTGSPVVQAGLSGSSVRHVDHQA